MRILLLTPLVVQLLEDLADDLANALQRLDALLGLVVLLLQALDIQAQRLQLRLPFPRLDELGTERLQGMFAFLVGSHGF